MAALPYERAQHVKETLALLRAELGTRSVDSLVGEPLELSIFGYVIRFRWKISRTRGGVFVVVRLSVRVVDVGGLACDLPV